MIFFLLWRCDPKQVMASSFLRFLDHTQRRSTVGRTPLDEWSARRRDLYLTTHNTHNKQISMPPVGFEPTISAGKRPQTYALDRAATGTGITAQVFVWKQNEKNRVMRRKARICSLYYREKPQNQRLIPRYFWSSFDIITSWIKNRCKARHVDNTAILFSNKF